MSAPVSSGAERAAPSAPGLRPARPADLPRLAAALAAAFYDDPVWGWLMPADDRRESGLRRFFAIELMTVGIARGQVWTTDDLLGAALSTPPGNWRLPWPVAVGHAPDFARVFGGRLAHALALLARMERRHLREPHHYFPYIGVAPPAQGRGLGTRLMAPTLERCDEEGLPAYLEASSERNAALYERLGFEHSGEITLRNSPPLFLMRRPAQARGADGAA